MDRKQQILIINGGSTYDSYEEYLDFLKTLSIDLNRLRPRKSWKTSLQENLGASFDVFEARMPTNDNAQYTVWKLWFEKLMILLDDNVILIGHSLGGIFLAKYLSENHTTKKIQAIFLIAAPFDDQNIQESLGSFVLTNPLDNFSEQTNKIFLYYSKDDVVVPFDHALKYQQSIPQAVLRSFEDRGHFNQEDFPELVGDIRIIV